ncbi:hypothetical protein [Thiohalorhabdus methylotrophus]|uniref:Zinc-ribbon domain-containing protein n=1 Tax=Thiohalorhabdus methylotrophus TaxID=3242694 RepID=A0ABV4TSD8_9GAMM
MSYRKSVFSYFDPVEIWHFHPDCPDWPARNYEERFWTPSHGQFCDRCVVESEARSSEIAEAPTGYRMAG